MPTVPTVRLSCASLVVTDGRQGQRARRRFAGLVVATTAAVSMALTACGDSDGGTALETPLPVVGSHDDQASAAASWLARQAGGDHLLATTVDDTPYPDEGLTADAVLALLGTGQSDAAQPLLDALVEPANLDLYVGDGAKAQYAGATAKLAATLSAAGRDPHDVAGRDLVAQLAALEKPSGRLSDMGADDYSQTVSQAWGVVALSRSGAGEAAALAAATSYLAGQQCDDGSFPAALDPTTCTGDVDATSFVVSALVAAHDSGGGVDDDVLARAQKWLEGASTTAGSGTYWRTGTPPAASVNSTAVAALALQDLGIGTGGSVAWLVGQQVTSGAGAGALTLAGKPDARSTAQGALAIAGRGYAAVFG
jgi:hypothetical protein